MQISTLHIFPTEASPTTSLPEINSQTAKFSHYVENCHIIFNDFLKSEDLELCNAENTDILVPSLPGAEVLPPVSTALNIHQGKHGHNDAGCDYDSTSAITSSATDMVETYQSLRDADTLDDLESVRASALSGSFSIQKVPDNLDLNENDITMSQFLDIELDTVPNGIILQEKQIHFSGHSPNDIQSLLHIADDLVVSTNASLIPTPRGEIFTLTNPTERSGYFDERIAGKNDYVGMNDSARAINLNTEGKDTRPGPGAEMLNQDGDVSNSAPNLSNKNLGDANGRAVDFFNIAIEKLQPNQADKADHLFSTTSTITAPFDATNTQKIFNAVSRGSEAVPYAVNFSTLTAENHVQPPLLIELQISDGNLIDLGGVPLNVRTSPAQNAVVLPSGTTPTVPLSNLAPIIGKISRHAVPGSLGISLSPVELGDLLLTLTPDGEKIHVHLVAERSDTVDLLRKNVEQFALELRQAGYSAATFSFAQDQKHRASSDHRQKNNSEIDEPPAANALPFKKSGKADGPGSLLKSALDMRF